MIDQASAAVAQRARDFADGVLRPCEGIACGECQTCGLAQDVEALILREREDAVRVNGPDVAARVVKGCDGDVTLYMFGAKKLPGGGSQRFASLSISQYGLSALRVERREGREKYVVSDSVILGDLGTVLLGMRDWIRGKGNAALEEVRTRVRETVAPVMKAYGLRRGGR